MHPLLHVPIGPVAPAAPAGTAAAKPRVVEILDRRRWNEIVLALGDPDLRQSFEWGEARRDRHAAPVRCAVLQDGVPVAALAAVAWRPGGAPWSIIDASRGLLPHDIGGGPCAHLVRALGAVARRHRAVLLRLSPGLAPDARGGLHDTLVANRFLALPDESTIWNAPRLIMTLDLRPDEAALRRAMRQSTRLSLTRLQGHGGRVEHLTSEAGVVRLRALLAAGGRRRGVPVRSAAYFHALREQYLARGEGRVILAVLGATDLAGLLAVRFGRRAHLLYSGTNLDVAATRALRAGTAVHWELIRWARAAGCDTLDWGGAITSGAPQASEPGFGIYNFKRGFGCRLTQLGGYYDLVFRPALYRAFRLLERRWAPHLWRLRAHVG